MTSHDQNDRERELQNREKELQDRELAIRMRELEAELQAQAKPQSNDAPPPPLYSPNSDRNSIKHRFRQFLKWSKIVGFSILGLTIAVIGIFVGIWLVYLAILGGIGWISYQILFGKNRSNRP